MTYEELKNFDKNRTNDCLIKKVRQLLYDFSYSDLNKIFSDRFECQIIRKSIINFLYSGRFTLRDDLSLTDAAKNKLKAAIFKDYKKAIDNLNKIEENSEGLEAEINNIKKIKKEAESSFDFDEHFYNSYFKIWKVINSAHKKYIKSIELVNYLLIYEAPPFSNEINGYCKEKYFLTSNKGNYAGSINDCFYSDDNVIKILKENNVIKILKENNVAYFDLIMGCLPIPVKNKKDDLRKKWCYNPDFKIGGKALPIVLLELGICYVLKNVKKPIIKFPKIAIGAPVNTSRSIFEYYTDNPMKVLIKNDRISHFMVFKKRNKLDICEFIFKTDKSSHSLKDFTEILSIDISGPNSINGFKKYKEGIFLPLHKANIISAANLPNGELLKNAFDRH